MLLLVLLHASFMRDSLHAGRYQANPANAVFQFFHNEEVRSLLTSSDATAAAAAAVA